MRGFISPVRRAVKERAWAALFTSGKEYTKDPLDVLRRRVKIAEAIEKLTAR